MRGVPNIDYYDRWFVSKIKKMSTTNDLGCWLIHKSLNQNGYHVNTYHNHSVIAHRKIYELCYGLTKRLVLDHYYCQIRNCCNPDHLEQTTIGENSRRGKRYLPPTHCKRGHEFTPENTYTQLKTGHRFCINCRRMHDREIAPKKKLWVQNNREKVRGYVRKSRRKNKEVKQNK